MSGQNFRQRLRSREALIGTFLKTPSPIMAEVLCQTELDVVCIDTEHAPFGRLDADLCIAALSARGCASLVRTGSDSGGEIRNALDSGAGGVVIPHVTSARQAAAIVKAAHFGEGGRGFAGSTRAAAYTNKAMAEHLRESREQTAVIVQIEDLAALDNVASIASVRGVDAIFIGRADLAVAMQKPVSDPAVIEQIEKICEAASSANAAVGMFTPDLDEISHWRRAGASLFLLSSDQSMVLQGASQLVGRFREQTAG